jgi:hypothetical protein
MSKALQSLAVAGAVFTAIARAEQSPPGPASPATGAGMLAGRVLDADSGQGIAGATVSLRLTRPAVGAAGPTQAVFPTVRTDSQGRFVFTMLPAGSFMATADRDGLSLSILQRVVDLAAGERMTDFNFRVEKLHTVLGTVRDDAGDPVVGMDVLAFARTASQGRPPVLLVRGRGRTDDQGVYRVNNLPAGHYLICACSRDPIPFDGQLLTSLAARPLDLLSVARRAAAAGSDAASLDSTLRTYAPTFYPNTPLASRAERVTVAKGENKSAVDITVATVRAVRVSGQIVGLPPSSISAAAMRLVPVGDIPEAAAITQLPPMLVQPDGRFDFAGVPPGTYMLEVTTTPGNAPSGPTGTALAFLGQRGGLPPPPPPPPPPPGRGAAPPPQEILWASETINVGDADVTGLVIGIQRGVNVRGKIEFAGSSPLPPANAIRGIVQLISMETVPGRSAVNNASINPDGTFAFLVRPGRYVLPTTPAFGPVWSTARSVTARGVDVLDAPLVIDGDVPDLVITMSDTPPSTLMGTAELPAGEIPEDWAVLIFPADRRYWKEPFGAPRRFQNVRLTAQRTFTPRLPPGDYLVALHRGAISEWMEAPALEELAKSATAVTLIEGDKKAVQVKR